MEIIAVLIILVLIDIAALYWGFDSRESIDSEEWERRSRWSLLVPMHHS